MSRDKPSLTLRTKDTKNHNVRVYFKLNSFLPLKPPMDKISKDFRSLIYSSFSTDFETCPFIIKRNAEFSWEWFDLA